MRIERYARGRNAGVCEKHNSFCASLCPAAQQQKLAILRLIWCYESLSSNLYSAVNKHYHATLAVHRHGNSRLRFSVRGTGARIVHVIFPCCLCAGSHTCKVLAFRCPLKNPCSPNPGFQNPDMANPQTKILEFHPLNHADA